MSIYKFGLCFLSTLFFLSSAWALEKPLVKNPNFTALEGWTERREGRGILRVEYRESPQRGLFLDGRHGFGSPSLVAISQLVDFPMGARLRMVCELTINEHDGKEGGAMVGLYDDKNMIYRLNFHLGEKKEKEKQKAETTFVQVEKGKRFRYISPDISSVVANNSGSRLVVGALGRTYNVCFHSIQFFMEEMAVSEKTAKITPFRVHTVHEAPGAGGRGAQFFTVSFTSAANGSPIDGVSLSSAKSRWLSSEKIGFFEVGPVDTKKVQEIEFSHQNFYGGTYKVRCSPPFTSHVHLTLTPKKKNIQIASQPKATIIGRVLHGLTTTPLQDVTLTIDGKISTVRTDLTGRFRLNNIVANQKHEIIFSLPGYMPVRRVFKAKAGERLQLLIGMQGRNNHRRRRGR